MKSSFWQVLLVVFGTLVMMVAVYQASVVGVLGRLGLVGKSAEDLFLVSALERAQQDGSFWGCKREWGVLASVRYYLGTERKKIEQGWEMGRQRMGCGIEEVIAQKGVGGTYKIIRGLRYWEKSLLLMEKNGGCEFLVEQEEIEKLGDLVNLAKGSAKVEIGRLAERVRERYGFEAERCIDQKKRSN